MFSSENHVLVLHTTCRRSYRDLYLADLILALLRSEKKVTMCTTKMTDNSPIMNVEVPTSLDENDRLCFLLPWKYLPNTLFGYLATFCLNLKLLWLVLTIMLKPPKPRPRLIITDINSTVLFLLNIFSSYKVIYIKHFSDLHSENRFYSDASWIPSLTFASSMIHADEIIVQTQCLKNILQRCNPRFNNVVLSVLNPCYDTGLWLHETLDVRDIVPMLPMQNFLFVVFGEFKFRTNLSLILKSMDFIVRFMEITFSTKVHLVIAGYSAPLSLEENSFYKKLQETTATKVYGDNITFLKQTTVFEQKTLIQNCTAVINPTNNNAYPGAILMAMNLEKPVISVDNGFARKVLINDVTGFLLYNHPSVFATKMEELAKTPEVGEGIVKNAKREFDEKYSFHAYSRQLNEIVDKHLNP